MIYLYFLFTNFKYFSEFLFNISSIGPNSLLKLSLVNATTFNLFYINYILILTLVVTTLAALGESLIRASSPK